MQFEAVIGLEVHVQLATKSKIFSGSATLYGAEPNTQACAVDLALPGTLPVLNSEAVNMAIKFGLATGAKINSKSIFARKNYFYPDLPKGYQISQHSEPVVGLGFLDVALDNDVKKRIGITRAHLEEDAGKLLHENFFGFSGVDLNRAGVALLEIVSEPDMRSSKEAVAYLKTLHNLVCYLDICDGNMQEGSFRCDANISVRLVGEKKFGTRAEIKNINSFRFVEKAINYEIERQIELIQNGQKVIQETRLYDSTKNITRSMRLKEEAHDYRYFPDPDLLPLIVTEEMITAVAKKMPELPQHKRVRLVDQYQLSWQDADLLVQDRDFANYFEATIPFTDAGAKLVMNWVMGELAGAINKNNISIKDSLIKPQDLAALLQRIHDKTISGKIAKTVFVNMWDSGLSADQIIARDNLSQVTDSDAVIKIVNEVINNNLDKVREYKNGKDRLFGFFVGQVLKLSNGQANPELVNQILKEKLAAV